MKPLVLALILGGIVGAGGATAFALNSMSHSTTPLQEAPAAVTSSASPPSSGPGSVSSSPSPSPSSSSPSTYRSQPAYTPSSSNSPAHPVHDADHVHDADDLDLTDYVHDADDIHHAVHVHVHVVVGFRIGQHVHVVKLVVVKLVQFGEFSEFGDLRTGLPVRIALTCNGTYPADRESPGG